MDKKAPVRNVLLREDDIFYVYDKRINKCVMENCEGVVKYGLTLKVNLDNGENLNSFECNKCHTKYTPYPNYVRISSPTALKIVNKSEVEARDKKRAKDAIKYGRNKERRVRYNKKSYHK